MTPLVIDRRPIVERGMAAVGVVPSLDEIKDRAARLGLGLEAPPAEQFAFQGGEEALAHGVVEAVAHGSHRRPHPGLLAAFAEGERSVLAALVGMMDHAGRASAPERHVERFGASSARRWVSIAQPTIRRIRWMGSWHWGGPPSSFLPNTLYQTGSSPPR